MVAAWEASADFSMNLLLVNLVACYPEGMQRGPCAIFQPLGLSGFYIPLSQATVIVRWMGRKHKSSEGFVFVR